jgi:hypothetical protein
MKIYEIYLKNNHKIGKRIKTKKKKEKENKKKFLRKLNMENSYFIISFFSSNPIFYPII